MVKLNILVPFYPLYVSTPREDYFAICAEAAGQSAQDLVVIQKRSTLSLLRSLWGQPVFAHGRGRWFPEFTSLLANRTIYNFYNNFIGQGRWAILLRRFLLNRCAFVVVQSEFARENYIRQGIRPEKLAILPIPVDYHYFAQPGNPDRFRKKWGLGNEPYAMCVGIRYHKNPWIMIEAARKAGVKMVMVGFKNTEDIRSWSREYLPQQGLLDLKDPNVILTGYLETEELRDGLAGCSAYLNSSESDGEVFCIAAYEAAAAGAPLCLADYGTFAIFKDAALFHSNHDSDELGRNIQRVVQDHALRDRLTTRAKIIARAHDYEDVRETYRQFFLKNGFIA